MPATRSRKLFWTMLLGTFVAAGLMILGVRWQLREHDGPTFLDKSAVQWSREIRQWKHLRGDYQLDCSDRFWSWVRSTGLWQPTCPKILYRRVVKEDPSAVQVLVYLLHDEDESVRGAAKLCLLYYLPEHPEAEGPLRESFTDDEEFASELHFVRILREMDEEEDMQRGR